MIRTFLLAPLLLTRTVDSLQDFTGIGTVQCPVAAAAADNTADNGEAPVTSSSCEFSYARPGGLIACVLDCPEAASFTVASLLMDAEKTYLPCECTQAINCPDACTFTAGATDSGGIFNTTTITTKPKETFQGAGRLTCPVDEYFAAPCIPLGEDCVGAGLVTCVATTLSTLNVTNTTISIDVNCDCVTLADCSAECSFEPMMTTQSLIANATGPGTLLCPSIDYAFHPCTLNVTQDDCNCEPTDFWRDSLLEFAVSLPCDCAIATNCPQSCEFTTEVITDELNKPDFTGPGIVTCSTEDYIVSPCRINFFNIFDCLTQSEECLSVSLQNPDDIAKFTDSQVAIALPCSCMTLSDCPDSCTFTNSSNEEAMPSSPTVTTPAPAATTTTITVPSLPPTASPVDASLAQNNNNTMVTPTAPAPMLPTTGTPPIIQPPVVGVQQESESGSTLPIAAGAFWTTTLSVFLLTVVG